MSKATVERAADAERDQLHVAGDRDRDELDGRRGLIADAQRPGDGHARRAVGDRRAGQVGECRGDGAGRLEAPMSGAGVSTGSPRG